MTQFRTFTEAEREALKLHGLNTDQPSQLSDAFVLGMRYAKQDATPSKYMLCRRCASEWRGECADASTCPKFDMCQTKEQNRSDLTCHDFGCAGIENDLHKQIMNIPINPEILQGLANSVERAVYKIGHRDARHAAAELVSASMLWHDSQTAAALKKVLDGRGDEADWTLVGALMDKLEGREDDRASSRH